MLPASHGQRDSLEVRVLPGGQVLSHAITALIHPCLKRLYVSLLSIRPSFAIISEPVATRAGRAAGHMRP